MWIVEALRKTNETVTLNGVTAEVLDPSPGQFGVFAAHEGDEDVLYHQLAGKGLAESGRGYELAVPHDGEVTLNVRLRGAPEGKGFPPFAKPDGGDGGGGAPGDTKGCLPAILAVIAAIVAAIRRLFKK